VACFSVAACCLSVMGGDWGREMTAGKCRAKLQLGGRNEDLNEGLKAGLGTYHGGKCLGGQWSRVEG